MENAKLTQLFARFDYGWDMETHRYKLRKSAQAQPDVTLAPYAFIIRRLLDMKGRHTGDSFDIRSPELVKVLKEINEGVENINLAGEEPEVSPEFLFHSMHSLRKQVEKEESQSTKNHKLISELKALLLGIEEERGYAVKSFESLVENQKPSQITFPLLWAIFKPNCLVYHYHPVMQQVRLLKARVTDYMLQPDGRRIFCIFGDVIHDDGESFGYATQMVQIEPYKGAVAIKELDVYPLEFNEQRVSILWKAVSLGKTAAQMSGHNYRELVSGAAMQEGEKGEKIKFFVSGRVMIAPSTFRRFEPNSITLNPRIRRTLSRDQLDDEQYAICSPFLLGFSMETKQWGAFAISRMKEITWNDDAFDALVLDNRRKELIHALVRKHASKNVGFDDVIAGKGRGLIGLLSGTPGCGKTLTAEAVAETTKKPLYAMSAGELGTTPEVVETKLIGVLDLAHTWGAVLLLDEADVFLQRRDVTNIQRNALVAIFLRHLEYYQGILILTTNMLDKCDAAFESRVHFSIDYPKLNEEARRKVWAMFFSRASIDVDLEDIQILASVEINGRQIKNAFSSATTIAEARGRNYPNLEDIQDVLGVLKGSSAGAVFSDYEASARHLPN